MTIQKPAFKECHRIAAGKRAKRQNRNSDTQQNCLSVGLPACCRLLATCPVVSPFAQAKGLFSAKDSSLDAPVAGCTCRSYFLLRYFAFGLFFFFFLSFFRCQEILHHFLHYMTDASRSLTRTGMNA